MPNANINFPAIISDGWIAQPSNGQGIAASKVIHYYQREVAIADPGVTVAAATKWIHVVQGTYGKLLSVVATLGALPTGNYTIVIDVQRSRAGGSFATVLSGTLTFNSSSTALVPQSLAVAAASQALQTGDVLEVIVTVTGSSGAQGSGLFVSAAFEESET